ncbi:MAG: NAD(P)/FAD-dependent oxidoreductase [Oscillospiraceae bacterium]|nr:NAD(P)/FAD-dependent oxidoreductase [Oscillospiraceae bacterium]
MKKLTADVAVAGGGAAGFMAAITAAELGARTVIVEPEDRPLKKLRITGKGRCNVTNDCDADTVIKNIPVNGKFLYSALKSFPPSETMAFFEGLGVALKTERGNRVFPVSDRAGDIAEALLRRAEELGVRLIRDRAADVAVGENGSAEGLKCSDTFVGCAAAVIATGGLSYPATGSTGDGYGMAKRLGHGVAELRPSLVPLTSPDAECGMMQGLSLRNVRLTVKKSGKEIFSGQGEMQFAHFGITGPLVLSASAHMRRDGEYEAEIDLKPALDADKLDARILRDFAENINRDFKNALGDLLPRLMIPVVISRSRIPPDTKVNSVTRAQREELVRLLKHFTVRIDGTRPVEEAVITSGGISVKEIVPSTMGSRIVNGLFFAGEIIDVDAYTGGFNLQIAWATGRAAGQAAAELAGGI